MSKTGKKPFYKKWWVWVIAVIIIGSAASGSGGEDAAEPASSDNGSSETSETDKNKDAAASDPAAGDKKDQKKEEKPDQVGIGEPLKVGDVVFTVHKKSTADNVGGQYGQDAQGTYLILDISIKNESKKPITTDSSFFTLSAAGSEYNADATADIYVNQTGGTFFLQEVNPGIEHRGKIIFDVPTDVASSDDISLNVQTGFFGTETGKINLK
jgi:hypothetical protein